MARLVEVGRFDNGFQAHRLAALLAEAGVEAEVEGEHAGTTLSHIGAIGVRVVVREEDAERAQEAIAAEREAASIASTVDDESGEEPEDASTGAVLRAEGANDGDSADDEESESTASTGSTGLSSPTAPATPEEIASAEAWARKTRDIAFLGVAFVVFALFALFRVLGPPRGVSESPQASRHLRQATIMAWTGVVIALIVLGGLARVVR